MTRPGPIDAPGARVDAFHWGRMIWLAEGAALGLSLAKMVVAPGAVSPAHRHANCTEAIHVEAGEIEQRLGARWVRRKAGETLIIRPRIIHQTRNCGRGDAVLTIAYSSGARAYEEVT